MPKLEIKGTNTGKGVFACEDILSGALIIEMTGILVETDEVESKIESGEIRADDPFQIAEDEFVILDALQYNFNHSCDPNAGLINGTFLTAIKKISKGEEICFDYSTVVCTHCDWNMECSCRSTLCRKTIGPADTLSRKTRLQYEQLHIIPEFILTELNAPGSPTSI